MEISGIVNGTLSVLKNAGVNCKVADNELRPINDVLRDSWYVDELIDRGYTDCIHIELDTDSCSGFMAVLNTGELMTGSNAMIPSGLECVIYGICDKYEEEPEEWMFEMMQDFTEENDDDSISIFTLDELKNFAGQIENNVSGMQNEGISRKGTLVLTESEIKNLVKNTVKKILDSRK